MIILIWLTFSILLSILLLLLLVLRRLLCLNLRVVYLRPSSNIRMIKDRWRGNIVEEPSTAAISSACSHNSCTMQPCLGEVAWDDRYLLDGT